MAKKDENADKVASVADQQAELTSAAQIVDDLIAKGKKLGAQKDFLSGPPARDFYSECKDLADKLANVLLKQQLLRRTLADIPKGDDINKPELLAQMLPVLDEAKQHLLVAQGKRDQQVTTVKDQVADLIKAGKKFNNDLQDWFDSCSDLFDKLGDLVPDQKDSLGDLNQTKPLDTLASALSALRKTKTKLDRLYPQDDKSDE